MWKLFLFVLISLFSSFSLQAATPKAGVWRLEIKYPHISIPFLLELEPQRRAWKAVLVNGKERINLDEIIVTKGKWIIPLQTYSNYLELEFTSSKQVRGHFVNPSKSPAVRLPITGQQGGGYRRFKPVHQKPTINLTGKWAIEMVGPKGDKTQAIALFDQMGTTINASILTPTGDYRYIDGFINGDEFEAAAFDGVFHFVFKGKLENGKLAAQMISKNTTHITGKLDPTAKLPDATKQTQVEQIQFSFPDVDGKIISLSDERYKGKPVIIQIFGSWCPNCIDELGFLGPWYEDNKSRGIEVVALSFERALTPAEAKTHLAKVVKRRQIPYPVLLAGTGADDSPASKLPGIKNFISFPTTIFLDSQHKVHKVHAGFNGPGTGLFYEEFKTFFHQTIEQLLKK